MLHQCETCGKAFMGRVDARYCCGACRAKAQRIRNTTGGEMVYHMSLEEVERVLQQAHQLADDMSRASILTLQPLSGALGRCAASIEGALRREGL